MTCDAAQFMLESIYRTITQCDVGTDYLPTQSNINRIALVSRWLTRETEDKRRHSLLLYGAYGTGKTTMLVSISTMLHHLNIDHIYTSAQALISTQDDKPKNIKGPLLIDELGRESLQVKSYGNASEPLIDLLCYRDRFKYPTIVASNLTDKELMERYGNHVWDRINGGYSRIFYNDSTLRTKR